MRGILVAVTLTGCATRTVVIAPGIVALSATQLRENGRATVYSMDGNEAEIHDHDRVDVHVRDGDLQTARTLTLGEMATGCETEPRGACLAERVVDQRLVVHHVRSVDKDLVAQGVGFLAIGALTGYCLAECQDDGSVARAYGYTGVAVAAAALLFVLLATLGGHD